MRCLNILGSSRGGMWINLQRMSIANAVPTGSIMLQPESTAISALRWKRKSIWAVIPCSLPLWMTWKCFRTRRQLLMSTTSLLLNPSRHRQHPQERQCGGVRSAVISMREKNCRLTISVLCVNILLRILRR